MAEEFVDDIWLWCVERDTRMSDVLSRVEDFKCETVQKLSLGQKATDRLEPPSSLRLEEF
jgi:hypothetical protein